MTDPSLFIARLGSWELLEGLMHTHYCWKNDGKPPPLECDGIYYLIQTGIFGHTLLECPPRCFLKRLQFLNTDVVFLTGSGKNHNSTGTRWASEGQGRKTWPFFLCFQNSSCSIYSFCETYTCFPEVSLKHYLGIYWSVDIYNVVSPRQDHPRSIIILGPA